MSQIAPVFEATSDLDRGSAAVFPPSDQDPREVAQPQVELPTKKQESVEPISDGQQVHSSYDGSNVVFRLLRMETWGPALMNLGYYRFRGPLAFLNIGANMELAQRRLVLRALQMLEMRNGQRVLDIACGRGKSSFITRCLFPQAEVVGLDLLPENVQVARTLFAQIGNLSYQHGNAMQLDFPDESFDRVICLEAAFHFPDRQQFLKEVQRVLRPGGKLVVVDFAWKSDAHRRHRSDPETVLVRQIWQWDDLYSIPDYARAGAAAGLKLHAQQDWSSGVTRPIQALFACLSQLGNSAWGRRFLTWRNPLYRSFSTADWKLISQAVDAHEHVHRVSNYMAFQFQKP